jgi:hypothetical protein
MHKVTLGTRTQSIADWIEERGADRGVVLIRVTAGWDLRKALNEPLRKPLPHPERVTRKKSTPWLGVFKRNDRPGYRVQIGRSNDDGEKRVRLGTFACDKEAAAVYNIWARTQFGVSAKINLT